MSDDILDLGFLVLADISGFTAFVTRTELQHGAWATGSLLETVMHRLAPPLEVQELEGDAVFALGPHRILPDGGALPGPGHARAATHELADEAPVVGDELEVRVRNACAGSTVAAWFDGQAPPLFGEARQRARTPSAPVNTCCLLSRR